MQAPAPASPHVRLTAMREAEVLFLLWEGCTRKRAAVKLDLSPKTVDTHCGRLHQRLGVDHDTGAVLWAVEHRNCCLFPVVVQSELLGQKASVLLNGHLSGSG